jgi:aerobic-type carbon monoxide dehydrogenase small subunit (CoxS/CutS family)
MTTSALAESGQKLTEDEIREELAGVMCRCTGYEFIVRAVKRYLDGEIDASGDDGSNGGPVTKAMTL